MNELLNFDSLNPDLGKNYCSCLSDRPMGDFKHLVLVKFKDGVVVEKLMEGMQNLVAEMDTVKSFEWGQNVLSEDMVTQGFTHMFLLTFRSPNDLATYANHPSHLEYAEKFTAAIDKVLLFDFPPILVKPSA
ncbi:stress-response A/B barrel domain-containing protein At5g22580-like [Phoenix dactylifera]|uniref:Stress-response A/B barrel domain-containing protein At5g22580-like n=1 Tax=Phoenix dactylifera TaxID=42345 RepID=A0A8B9A0M0_PHODC|nr:stress-response A/B barrel domain-containing protein At5g22580-like [Phoenix dactylifera]